MQYIVLILGIFVDLVTIKNRKEEIKFSLSDNVEKHVVIIQFSQI